MFYGQVMLSVLLRLNDAYEGALPQRGLTGDNMYSRHELNAEGQKQEGDTGLKGDREANINIKRYGEKEVGI
jgi:hypothetical protein